VGERLHAPGDERPSLRVSRLTVARTPCSRAARESSGLSASLRPAPLTGRPGAVLAGGGSAPCHLGYYDDDEGDRAVVSSGEPIHLDYVLVKRDRLTNVTSLEHERWKRAHPEFCRIVGDRAASIRGTHRLTFADLAATPPSPPRSRWTAFPNSSDEIERLCGMPPERAAAPCYDAGPDDALLLSSMSSGQSRSAASR
jgi:hypothetical protein